MRKCRVRFTNMNNSKMYTFFTNIDDLEFNEKIIVDTTEGLTPAYFQDYNANPNTECKRWVIGKLDLTEYEEKKRVILSKLEIENQIKQILDQYSEVELYSMIGEHDKNVATLVDALKNI